jgi:EAL domain-containing protein (putative c-di-GMP-specific phosphodiesterase class I)
VLSWTDRLQRALESDQLLLHYQPILDLKTNVVTQHEALVRMRGDDGELIPPGAFLPAAERSGLIRDLDLWVVERAISVIADAKEAGAGEPTIQVNLSARSTADTSLATLIIQRIDTAGIDPSKIIFEITETAAIANMERASEFARALAERGCGFALDDFGAGFASFHYLRSLPLTYIKIDGDFVADLAVSEVNQALVSGLKGVADGLGLKLIAECVEQQETLEILKRYGVDYAQGYLIARPSEDLPAVSADLQA